MDIIQVKAAPTRGHFQTHTSLTRLQEQRDIPDASLHESVRFHKSFVFARRPQKPCTVPYGLGCEDRRPSRPLRRRYAFTHASSSLSFLLPSQTSCGIWLVIVTFAMQPFHSFVHVRRHSIRLAFILFIHLLDFARSLGV